MAEQDTERRMTATPDSRITRLAAGVEVDSRYRLEQLAGTGGMSTVWRAHDTRLGRTVAIKIMSDSLAADGASVTRFRREIRTHSNINHPNLVRVFDYDVNVPRPYLVMEYIDGATLSERLDAGDLSSTQITSLAADLLSAIACVHDRGVLHRDIKPANILIDSEGRARLTDFGIAHLNDVTRLTMPGDIVGTLRFLSPELMAGGSPSPQSDLFALGITLRTIGEQLPLSPELQKLTDWLTQPRAGDRPPDAHSALWVLGNREPPPIGSIPHEQNRDSAQNHLRPPTTGRSRRLPARWRPRAAAAAALLVAIVSVGVTVAESGGATPAPPHAGRSAHRSASVGAQRSMPTINSDLNTLAAAVRQAGR
jgi:serine/threonine protein kinase